MMLKQGMVMELCCIGYGKPKYLSIQPTNSPCIDGLFASQRDYGVKECLYDIMALHTGIYPKTAAHASLLKVIGNTIH